MKLEFLKKCSAVVLATLVCACSREEAEGGNEAAATAAKKTPIAAVHTPGKPRPPRVGRPAKAPPPKVVDLDDRTDLSPADKSTLKTIEKAMEDEDVKLLLGALPAASKSATAEVRSEMVDALGWFGVKTMAELTPFMADSDEDIAQTALDNWISALGDIESEKDRGALIEGVMKVITNPDSLESLVMELNDCEDDIAIQSLVNIIEGGENAAAGKVAREHYEFMTGDEYAGVEAAEKWLRENQSE